MTDVLDPGVLTERAPQCAAEEAMECLRRHWALEVVGLSALPSERDQNFAVDTPGGRHYVFKIANRAESPSVTRLQTAVLLHVARADPGLPVPRVVPTVSGELSACAWGSTLRLLTWMRGTPWHRAPPTRRQRESLALGHARLVRALGDFTSDEPLPVLQWDIQHAARLAEHVEAVRPELRAPVEEALARFARHAADRLPSLPRQFVHNDIQPHNVVVEDTDTDRLAGILDFGDLVRAPVACDLAIAAAYHVGPGPHPLATVGEYVAAFHAIRPLSAPELEVLPSLVMARQVTTLVVSSVRARDNPHNAAYLTRNQPVAAAGLLQLLALSDAAAVDYLAGVCA